MRRSIRHFALLLLCGLALGGCGVTALSMSTGLVVADGASVMALHHDVFDLLVSGITSKDCSIVRLDRGKSYCAPTLPPSEPPEYCTRTLGVPECWASPLLFANPPRGLADGPWALTPEQEAHREFPLFPATR
jgi:hypothetical protein